MTAQGQAVAQAIADRIRDLEAQRDELLAAMEKIASCQSKWPGDVVSIAQNVLANFEAKK